MKIAVVIVAFNQPEWLSRLIESGASVRHDVVYELHLHSTDGATVAACEALARREDVCYHAHKANRGLSRTWNDAILAGYDAGAHVVIVTNDDICFSPGDLDRLAERAADSRDSYIVSSAGYHERLGRQIPSLGYSCFAINPVALTMIGCFDENFFPAYCEDQDYARRAGLAGLSEENCSDTMVRHGGSSTIFADTALRGDNAVTQAHNLAYYRRKWGGLAGEETHDRPFGDPRIPLRIAPEIRAHPYGAEHDRSDRPPA